MFFPDVLFGNYHLAVLAKLLLAGLAGAVIGLEREKHGRPAGLRTHLLVSLGACLMMIVSEAVPLKYSTATVDSALRIDPARIAAQIVVGLGVLGAGVIIKEGVSVRGLTTAASLWMVAGLGMAFGLGLFVPGLLAAGIALFSLLFLKKLEPVIRKDRFLFLTVVAHQRPGIYDELERLFAARQLRIADLESDLDMEQGLVRYEFIITQHHRRIGQELSEAIRALDGVRRIKFK
jgi:putative Mg2+ transporter-C (MgtC) family protein